MIKAEKQSRFKKKKSFKKTLKKVAITYYTVVLDNGSFSGMSRVDC